MSTTSASPTKHNFFVWAPDKTNEGTLARRLEVREKHLETAKERIEGKFIRVGGMVTTPEAVTNPDAPKKMVGSTFICQAESIDVVWKALKDDIYYTHGVWDPEKIVVLPWFGATPLP